MASNIFANIFGVISQTLMIYSYILIIRVLLTWFPNLDWSNPILTSVRSITDPYLNIFRGIIPPLGGLDLSPILAFIVLSLSQDILLRLSYTFLNSSFVQYYN